MSLKRPWNITAMTGFRKKILKRPSTTSLGIIWEAFSHAARRYSITYPPLSLACYSFIQLSELWQCGVNKIVRWLWGGDGGIGGGGGDDVGGIVDGGGVGDGVSGYGGDYG